MSAVFENRDTVLLQVQEMLRTERITRPDAVQHELDTYNELLPGPGELSCTLMIEIPEKAEREAFLVAARGLERHIWLVDPGHRIQARSLDRAGQRPDRTTAVHYLKFDLPPDLADALRGAALGQTTLTHLVLELDHPTYAEHGTVGTDTLLSLGRDLAAG
jgi:hypothetical protein